MELADLCGARDFSEDSTEFSFYGAEGLAVAKIGDWVVFFESGTIRRYSDAFFRELFTLA